jgi:uncharacterized membrane protein
MGTQEYFKVNEIEKHLVEQIRYKVTYNQRNYTFTDYVYVDSGEPVVSGEFASLIDNQGNTVKDQKVFDTIVDYIISENY